MPSSYLLQAASSGIGRDRRLQRSCLLGLVRFCCWRSRETSVFCPTPPKTRVLSPQFSTAHGRFDRLRVRTKCALGCTRACECSWPQVGYRLPTGHRAHPSRRPTQAGGGFLKEKRNGKSSLTLGALWARFPTPRCKNLSPSPDHVDPVPVSPTRCTSCQSPKIRRAAIGGPPERACSVWQRLLQWRGRSVLVAIKLEIHPCSN